MSTDEPFIQQAPSAPPLGGVGPGRNVGPPPSTASAPLLQGTLLHVFLQNSTTISLLLRYLDLSVGAFQVLDLQCPHGTAAPATGPPSTPDLGPPGVPGPKVLCSSHQMAVELPAGAVSGIYVKGVWGNVPGVHVHVHTWLPPSTLLPRGHAGIHRGGGDIGLGRVRVPP